MRLVLALLLVTGPVLAGCLGAEDGGTDPLEAQADDPSNEEGAEARPTGVDENATEAATNDTANTTTTEPAANESDSVEPTLELVEHALAWDGHTGTWAFVCVNPGSRVCTPFLGQTGETIHNESVEGELETIKLTVTWDAQTPPMERLDASIGAVDSNGTYEWVTAQGTSPLELKLEAPADAKPWFWVWVRPLDHRTIATHHAFAIDQPFHVEGTYTTLVEVEP